MGNVYSNFKNQLNLAIRPFVSEKLANGKYDLADSLFICFMLMFFQYAFKKIFRQVFGTLFGFENSTMKYKVIKFMIKHIPKLNQKFKTEMEQTKKMIAEEMCGKVDQPTEYLPEFPMKENQIQERLEKWYKQDEKLSMTGKISGSRYADNSNYEDMMKECCKNFFYHNPLHTDQFPATRQIESEVIRMTCKIFKNKGSYGCLTSGGTESILLSILAHREWKASQGVTKPNLVCSSSCHPAFDKACTYYNIEIRKVNVNENYNVDVKDLKKRIDYNTIAVIASCPGFPHGIQEPVEEIAKLAKSKGIGCHVDCCLGSFVVPWAKQAGANIDSFDFSVDGVTSISCDHHKYALAPKGVSIAMFHSEELRHFAYYKNGSWSGGIYATPSFAGSRGSAPIVGAWVAMQYHGQKKYLENAALVVNAVKQLSDFLKAHDELNVIGDPKVCVVAFTYKKDPTKIYNLDIALHKKEWSCAALQNPPCLHISMTIGFATRITQFIQDLKECLELVKQNPEEFDSGGSVALYGTASKVPDTGLLNDTLNVIIDTIQS